MTELVGKPDIEKLKRGIELILARQTGLTVKIKIGGKKCREK
jgi:hypothetical protein